MCVCTGIHSQVHVGTWVEAWIQWWRQNKSIIYGCENKEVPNSSWLTTVWVYFLLLLCVVGCGSAVALLQVSSHCSTQAEWASGTLIACGRRKAHIGSSSSCLELAFHWPKQVVSLSLLSRAWGGRLLPQKKKTLKWHIQCQLVEKCYPLMGKKVSTWD